MKKILVIGAGRSATSAIEYLLDKSEAEDWEICVADYNLELAKSKVDGHPRGSTIFFDAFDEEVRRREIDKADLVMSFLPPHMHVLVAGDCVRDATNLVTASYVSEEMAAWDTQAKAKGIILLNELGADPGIDHMSAMETIDRIKAKGGHLEEFRSYCGALVAPESDNIWGYKFTWAPRNIILAGQGGPARYLKNNRIRYIPYLRLFDQVDTIEVPGYGKFEAYANRNSLKYREPYQLHNTPTLYRATLRKPGYAEAWHILVSLGLTDDSYKVDYSSTMPWREFALSYIPEAEPGLSPEERLAKFTGESMDSPIMKKLLFLGLLSDRPIGREGATPARMLQDLLEEKWEFEEGDVDMLVMQHQFTYRHEGKRKKLYSSMVVKGLDHLRTAIARTVGLPAAMGARLILNGEVTRTGVHIPTTPDLYGPILKELEDHGIVFSHREEEID